MSTNYDVILSPVITEKATRMTEANQVVFRVTLDATKPAIAKAVADLFKVKVKAVNTIIVKGKRKAARGKVYTRSDIKKAIVTLEEGHQIDITTGLKNHGTETLQARDSRHPPAGAGGPYRPAQGRPDQGLDRRQDLQGRP